MWYEKKTLIQHPLVDWLFLLVQNISLVLCIVPGGDEDQKVLKFNETQTVLSGLDPHTNYTIYVVAYKSVGASDHSESVFQMTGEDGK